MVFVYLAVTFDCDYLWRGAGTRSRAMKDEMRQALARSNKDHDLLPVWLLPMAINRMSALVAGSGKG